MEARWSFLAELISRMCLSEPGVNSADSVSWHAHREAERLSDSSLVHGLEAYLSSKRSKDERRQAYCVLGKVGKNTGSVEAARILLRCVASETDKYALSVALDMISDLNLEGDEDISPITRLLLDGRWLVRHAAIRALRASTSSDTESIVIALLKSTQDEHDKVYCHSTLNCIGTAHALPILQVGAKSRKRDVSQSAAYAIENIQRRVAAT